MLLRGSGDHTGHHYAFDAVTEEAQAEDAEAGGIANGGLLRRFADAVYAGDFAAERSEVRQVMGDAALVDAAAVIAIFSAVVKIADGIGIPLEPAKAETSKDFRAALGIDAFART